MECHKVKSGNLSQKTLSCIFNRKYSFIESACQSNTISSVNAVTVWFSIILKNSKFYPWVRKIPRSGSWQPTPVFLESHGQRRLAGYSLKGRKESDNWSDLARTKDVYSKIH